MWEERERGIVSLKTTLFCFIYLVIYGVPKNGLQQMPPLYNTYGAGILHNKFYKDKQN
jgi:uncharacterized protein YhaN